MFSMKILLPHPRHRLHFNVRISRTSNNNGNSATHILSSLLLLSLAALDQQGYRFSHQLPTAAVATPASAAAWHGTTPIHNTHLDYHVFKILFMYVQLYTFPHISQIGVSSVRAALHSLAASPSSSSSLPLAL